MANGDRMRRNATTSPLLKLPAEIRERILTFVLGGMLIHIRCTPFSFVEFTKSRVSKGVWAEPGFSRYICQEKLTETQSRNKSRQGYPVIPTSDMKEYYIKQERECHARCYKPGNEKQVNLQILGSSRQLYEEANYLLWSTNTFSFDDSFVLGRFLECLNASQKQKLQKLHLITDMEFVSRYRELISSRHEWEIALKPEMTYLKNLTSLHLRFDLRYGGPPDKEEHAAHYGGRI